MHDDVIAPLPFIITCIYAWYFQTQDNMFTNGLSQGGVSSTKVTNSLWLHLKVEAKCRSWFKMYYYFASLPLLGVSQQQFVCNGELK